MVKVAASILSADFLKLGDEVKEMEAGGADAIHIDIMDGHFVPNITMGPLIVEAIRPITTLPFDVHLMVEHPEQYIDVFVKAGADLLSIHVESCQNPYQVIQAVKQQGVQAGIVLNPATPIDQVKHILPDVDSVLLMTVNPGFGGQTFLKGVLPKIKAVSNFVREQGLPANIRVDGGVNYETARLCMQAGAEVLISGSAIFNQKNRKAAIEQLKSQLD